MKLEGFGVHLESLTLESAEIVRQWRNQAQILEQMEYQRQISKEAQQAWFQDVQNDSCRYFLIVSNDLAIGMIHLAHVDPLTQTAEAGLFIGEPTFSGTGTALGASLLLLDYAFDALHLKIVTAKVRNTNKAAQQYNELLGFIKAKEMNEHFSAFELPREIYFNQRPKLAKLVSI